ncbi:hypothetical protein GCM10009798_17770 [Nocardioides panacihumi]|uniref:DUF202 domain-containing protein n=1 Tax=Nocardioides panacihumi TaxID=400774 RepID=A0ABN2QUW7_9ACTN
MKAPTGDGLQASRTELSWRRTVASVGATAALVAHHAMVRERAWSSVLLLLGAAVAASGVVIGAHVRRRQEHTSSRLVRLTSAAVGLLAVLALVALCAGL